MAKTEIYLFRDAVTGTLIPELTLRSLPREQKIHMGAEDLQSLSPCTSPDCPDALELEQLLKEFRYNHTFLQENPEDVDFDDPYVIETLNAWNDNDDEESDTWDDMDLWDDGFPGMTQTDGELPSALQIHDRYAGKSKCNSICTSIRVIQKIYTLLRHSPMFLGCFSTESLILHRLKNCKKPYNLPVK